MLGRLRLLLQHLGASSRRIIRFLLLLARDWLRMLQLPLFLRALSMRRLQLL
jgi:hypothetical protein